MTTVKKIRYKKLIYCKFCGLTFDNEEDYKCHRIYKHGAKIRCG